MIKRTIVYHVADYQIISLYDSHGQPTFKILPPHSYTMVGGYRTKITAIRAARKLASKATAQADALAKIYRDMAHASFDSYLDSLIADAKARKVCR